MINVHGTCDDQFGKVRLALERNLAADRELGASIFLDVEGQTRVDLWGGHRDPARTSEWTRDTITNVWSTTKTVTSLAALLLVERGLLDVYAPVAKYWPDFAANGKGAIEVRHLMAHTSGVSGWEQPVKLSDIYDWDHSTRRLAAQAPWWAPGSASGYHAISQGHLVGEVIRRISGLSPREFVAQELAGPLGADFQIGARKADWGRIADIVPPPPLPLDLKRLDPKSPMVKTFTGPSTDPRVANTPEWRSADLGAVNGHGNARSVARLLSAISLGGTVDGKKLLSQATIDLIFEEQACGNDLVLGIPLRFGIGFALPLLATMPYIPEERQICFWGGWGGSLIVMDTQRRMTFCYVMNKMDAGIIGSERSATYLGLVYEALRD